MRKVKLHTAVPSTAIFDDVTEARLMETVSTDQGEVKALLMYGTDVGDGFRRSPKPPPNAVQLVDIRTYGDVWTAYQTYVSTLMQRLMREGLMPEGSEE